MGEEQNPVVFMYTPHSPGKPSLSYWPLVFPFYKQPVHTRCLFSTGACPFFLSSHHATPVVQAANPFDFFFSRPSAQQGAVAAASCGRTASSSPKSKLHIQAWTSYSSSRKASLTAPRPSSSPSLDSCSPVVLADLGENPQSYLRTN